MKARICLLLLALYLPLATTVLAADVKVESELTPNQQRHITQVNQDLHKDIVDQTGDSRKVAELRGRLRQELGDYQATVRKFGNGVTESRKAAHQVMETQQALHKQFYLEEAIPAVASSR
jgi:hypothetical protein